MRIHCQNPWFDKIRSGEKKVEGRKAVPKYRNIRVGDSITFYCDADEFDVVVVAIKEYPSLETYLIAEGVSAVLPGVSDFSEAVRIYESFNSRSDLDSYGFLGIHVTLKG